MKAAVWRRMAKQHVVPALPDARLAGSTMVFGPIDWILHAVVVETSAFSSTSVSFAALNQPLYVPTEGLTLSYGDVLRHPRFLQEWWDVDPGNEEGLAQLVVVAIMHQARKVFASAESPSALATYSEERYIDWGNPPEIEAEALSWALAGNVAKFAAARERMERAVAAMSPAQPWGKPMLEHVRAVSDAVEQGTDGVRQLLGRWRDNNVRQHKLEKLTTPYTSDHW